MRLLDPKQVLIIHRKLGLSAAMAKSVFEYVKDFELNDSLLPNTWIVVRLDGKRFHKFSVDHNFEKPNDIRALRLMNYSAFTVLAEFQDLLLAYGQSDEYSFIFKRNCNLYNRRASKLLSVVNSKFSASFVYYWRKFFGDQLLLYPPCFDGRVVLYPSDQNLIDYLSWRQADVHINNLYNTTFWNLILKGKLTPSEAEKRLSGTVSAEKNEILFSEFNINYNNEPIIFKRGTILLRKVYLDNTVNKSKKVIVDIHEDMLKPKFWQDHAELLSQKDPKSFTGDMTDIINEQLGHTDTTEQLVIPDSKINKTCNYFSIFISNMNI